MELQFWICRFISQCHPEAPAQSGDRKAVAVRGSAALLAVSLRPLPRPTRAVLSVQVLLLTLL